MFRRIKVIAHAWGHYECASLAAGVAFYAALSIFPLMMVLVAGVGYFFRFMPGGPSAREEIFGTLSRLMSAEFSDSVSQLLLQVQDRALVNGPLAGVAFLFTASLVFAQIDRGFYRIWDVNRRSKEKGVRGAVRKAVSSRARSLAMIVAVCLLVIMMFLLGLGVRALGEFNTIQPIIVLPISRFLSLSLGAVINVAILTLLYQYLSKAKVSWKLSFVSALVAAGLWELASPVMSRFSFGASFSVYGLIGSFLAVLVWIYVTVMILFIGALIVRVEKQISRQKKSSRT